MTVVIFTQPAKEQQMNQYTIEFVPVTVLNHLLPKLESIDSLLIIDIDNSRIHTDLTPAELENLTHIHLQQQNKPDYQAACVLF